MILIVVAAIGGLLFYVMGFVYGFVACDSYHRLKQIDADLRKADEALGRFGKS